MYLFKDQFQELVRQICNRISLSSNKNFKNINILWHNIMHLTDHSCSTMRAFFGKGTQNLHCSFSIKHKTAVNYWVISHKTKTTRGFCVTLKNSRGLSVTLKTLRLFISYRKTIRGFWVFFPGFFFSFFGLVITHPPNGF